MLNWFNMDQTQFTNLIQTISASGGADIAEQLEAINETLQNLQIQFSAIASNVSLDPIVGLTATNVQEGISELNSSLNSTTNVTSTTHTVSGKFSQIGKSVILSMSIVATSESNVLLNTPKPIKQCVALARSINTGNTVRIFMSSSYNTAYFLDTPVVGNTYDFSVSYITN